MVGYQDRGQIGVGVSQAIDALQEVFAPGEVETRGGFVQQ